MNLGTPVRCLVFWLLSFGVSVAGPRPNIVFILADDLGWGDVGFNGQTLISTPHLDQLAAEGLVFTQHYAGSTVCMPSRASLLTGLDTGNGTVRGNPRWSASGKAVDLPGEEVTIAEELKRFGYRTAVIGKWGLAEGGSAEALPWNQGFDYFFGYLRHRDAHSQYPPYLWRNHQRVPYPQNDPVAASGTYAPDELTREALAYIEADPDQPFFLFFSLNLPHYELSVPEDSKDPYRSAGWPRRTLPRGHYRHDPAANLTYAGMVSRLDRYVGEVVSKLRDLGLDRNTLLFFSSDNGPVFEREDQLFNSNGLFRGGKRDLFEGGIRVPLVAWWPGMIEPGYTAHISAFSDVLPTLCELVGSTPTDAKKLRSLSFLPTLRGQPEGQAEHPFLYWEFNESAGPQQALRRGPWKLIVRHGESPALYNLEKDPGELNDVAASHRSELTSLLGLLSRARSSSAEFPLTPRRISPR